jgi:hypothetical protein
MNDLEVVSDSFEFRGSFSDPPMTLWGQTHLLVGGLYELLRGYNVRLRDIRVLPGSENAGDGLVTISLGRLLVEFRFDSYRILVADGAMSDIETISSVLRDLNLWLQRAADVDIVSHAIGYSAHCKFLDGSNSDVFLGRFLASPPWPGALQRPAGVIFHYVTTEWLREARISLTVDHSLLVPGGLWIAGAALHDGRDPQIGQAILTSPSVLAALLDALQLRIPERQR